MIDSLVSPPIDLRQVGRHMPRPRSQEGWLSDRMPKRGKLPRGRFFARWRVYFRGEDGTQRNKKAERVIDRELADRMGFTLSYDGPLTKTDARSVLRELIRESNAAPLAFSAKTTFAELAREYIELNKPNWGENTIRVSEPLIERHLIDKLGGRRVRELAEPELQHFINGYVGAGASKSQLGKLVLYLRAILELAVDHRLIDRNPARKLKAKSRRRPSNLAHTAAECGALFAEVSGRDHLIIRIAVQLGLRSEELFALRRNDVREGELIIDEALVNGHTKEPKTLASAASAYVPADLALELKHYLETVDAAPSTLLFSSTRKGVPLTPNNFLRRVLKPAAVRAGVALRKLADGEETTALNFVSLRRTSATLFGTKAKDPKSTQAHMRHTDPQVTLKHYQQAIPGEVKAAAIALESELLQAQREREAQLRKESSSARLV